MTEPTEFGKYLREKRKAAGLTQDDLAESIGKTGQYISNIEKGKNNSPPDDNDLHILINKLNLSGEEAERFRLLAYADRGMLPPEMFRYVLDRPALIGLINYALSNGVSEEYWSFVLKNTTTEKGWIHNE